MTAITILNNIAVRSVTGTHQDTADSSICAASHCFTRALRMMAVSLEISSFVLAAVMLGLLSASAFGLAIHADVQHGRPCWHRHTASGLVPLPGWIAVDSFSPVSPNALADANDWPAETEFDRS